MPIVNKTKDSVLSESFEECHTVFHQTLGMMFRKEVVPLVFYFNNEQIVRLHSWFCPAPMDLVLLDENWVVVEMLSEWLPKSTFTSSKQAMFLLELPVGSIAHSGTDVGDVVNILK